MPTSRTNHYFRSSTHAAIVIILFSLPVLAYSAESLDIKYSPAKVVYDFSHPAPKKFSELLDRISLLQNIYGSDPFNASIIVVIHETPIKLFAKANLEKNKQLMQRVRDLSLGEVIEFRLCQASARMQDLKPKDIVDSVSMVPMADAEIIRLQNKGYVFMQ